MEHQNYRLVDVTGAVSQSFDQAVGTADAPNLDRSEPIHKMDDSQLVGVQPTVSAGDSVAGGGHTSISTTVVVESGEAKRKRGRPARGQAKPPPAKKNKEEEDVCFICFDGGSLVLCDRRGCPKAYHPACIKRDEAFFRSKAKWNCGWHICSICQKAAHHMCYTCTYSLCKGCIKNADYVCVRGDKGFCTICMRTIMLIENNVQGKEEMAQVDFDDKSSWEYLFKVYWVYLKGKLSLTLNELTQAKNPWKGVGTVGCERLSPDVQNGANDLKSLQNGASDLESLRNGANDLKNLHNGANALKSFTSDMSPENQEANNMKRRKTDEQLKLLHEATLILEKPGGDSGTLLVGCKEWATKELLEFVAHMRNGDTSAMSQFDVQALMLDYIKKNNLRDPRRKSQIICDFRLKNLFGKPRVGHFEMLKLLEFHFLIKEDSQKNIVDTVARQVDPDWNNDSMLMVDKDKKRKPRRKGEERAPQANLDEYAAIDVHNINLIYLRRNLMENLLEDDEKFHSKVVGSIVRIRISSSDQKQDMYRLVQVVGTSKVDLPYKIGNKTTNVVLEVLNLDKKETVSADTISNQEFSEDECRRLRQSIRCGLVKQFTIGEILEKAVALQSVRLNDWLETEILRLNHLRDRASEKGRKKELRECVEKLQLLKTPEERQRRLSELPEVHADPKMNPDCESEEDAGELKNNKWGEYMKTRYSGYSGKGGQSSSPQKRAECSNDTGGKAWKNLGPCQQTMNTSTTLYSEKEEGSNKAQGIQQNEVNRNGSAIGSWNNQAAVTSASFSAITSDTSASSLTIANTASANDSEADKLWHYRDPNGRVQGPFTMVQLQKWSTTGYFPPDMRIWASRQEDSVLLTDALKGEFHKPLRYNASLQSQEVGGASDSKSYNYDVRWSENNSTQRVSNQTEGTQGRSPLASSTHSGPNVGNHENHSDNRSFSGQSSGQNWRALPLVLGSNNSNSNPSVAASVTKSTYVIEMNGAVVLSNLHSLTPKASNDNWEGQVAKKEHHMSSVLPVRDSDIVDLPSPTPKTSNKDDRLQDNREKQSVPSKLVVQDSGPSWSSASNLVVGGAQLAEIADEWGGYSPTPAKPSTGEWDSGLVSVSSMKQPEAAADRVATSTSNIEQLIHSSPSQPASTVSWQAIVSEPIEFSTLAEESVSDLLAEVDAMESQCGLASPTSKRNCGDDFIHGSIEEFSPTPDQGARSDGFSSSGDMHLPCQSTTPEELVGASPGNVFDFLKRSEVDGEAKSSAAPVNHGNMVDTYDTQRTRSEDIVASWSGVEKEKDIRDNVRGSDLQAAAPLTSGQVVVSVAGRAGDGTLLESFTRAEAEGETESSDVRGEVEEDGEFIEPTAPNLVDPPNIAQKAKSEVTGSGRNNTTIQHGGACGVNVPGSATKAEEEGEIKSSDVPITIQHDRAGGETIPESAISAEEEGEMKSSDVPVELEKGSEDIHRTAPLTISPDVVEPNIAKKEMPEVTDSGWNGTTIQHGGAGGGTFQESATRAEEEGEIKSSDVSESVQSAAPLTMRPELVDQNNAQRAGSGWGRSSQGTTNTGRGNASMGRGDFSGNVVAGDSQRRYGGERFSGGGSRDRAYNQGGDSGFSRGRPSWNRQSYGGAGGGGYSRPPPKGQRVCKFYESGRCKKGALCDYLHP